MLGRQLQAGEGGRRASPAGTACSALPPMPRDSLQVRPRATSKAICMLEWLARTHEKRRDCVDRWCTATAAAHDNLSVHMAKPASFPSCPLTFLPRRYQFTRPAIRLRVRLPPSQSGGSTEPAAARQAIERCEGNFATCRCYCTCEPTLLCNGINPAGLMFGAYTR